MNVTVLAGIQRYVVENVSVRYKNYMKTHYILIRAAINVSFNKTPIDNSIVFA